MGKHNKKTGKCEKQLQGGKTLRVFWQYESSPAWLDHKTRVIKQQEENGDYMPILEYSKMQVDSSLFCSVDDSEDSHSSNRSSTSSNGSQTERIDGG